MDFKNLKKANKIAQHLESVEYLLNEMKVSQDPARLILEQGSITMDVKIQDWEGKFGRLKIEIENALANEIDRCQQELQKLGLKI